MKTLSVISVVLLLGVAASLAQSLEQPASPEFSLDEMDAFIQADIDGKLEALNSGEPCCEDEEEPAAYQAVDLDDGSQAMVFGDFALLATVEGPIIGLNMIPVQGSASASGTSVHSDCQLIGDNTMFCSYIWGNQIRIIIFQIGPDGNWRMVFDSGWFQRKQDPTPAVGMFDPAR